MAASKVELVQGGAEIGVPLHQSLSEFAAWAKAMFFLQLAFLTALLTIVVVIAVVVAYRSRS